MMRQINAFVVVALGAGAFVAAAHADTYTVPGDFDTIQDAIDGVTDGDEILIGPGTFNEAINPGTKSIAIRGSIDGEGVPTTILESSNSSAITISNNSSTDLVIENLELHGNTYWSISRGGGINCIDSRPTVRNCVFDGCTAINGSYNYGGGLYVLAQYSSLAPTIIDCVFRQNEADYGGAIYFYRHTSSTDPVFMPVSGCLFEDNEAPDGGGAIYMYGAAGMALDSCVFRNNLSGGDAGGIENASSLTSLYGCSLCAPDTTAYGQLVNGNGWVDVGFNCLTHDCTDTDGDDRPDHCDQCDGPDVDKNLNGWADCAEVDNGDGTMTWHVRAGTQIQPAVHISGEGDTIKLGPGVFDLELNQSIDLKDYAIRFSGTAGASGVPATVINSFDASTIWIMDNDSPELVVENLELHGNTFWSISRGGGIYCADSRPTIRNCVFDGCTATNGSYNYGGGLYVLAHYTAFVPTIIDCIFRQNVADYGGAIYFYRHTSSTEPVTMSISSTRFDENLAQKGGGAIYMYGVAGVDLDIGLFRMNASPQGDAGGIENASASTTSIHGVIFCAPTSNGYYGPHINGSWSDLGLNCFTEDCTDADGDGIPDDCEFTKCQGDLDGDGSIGGSDLALLLGAWGSCTPAEECPYDLNDDGVVNGADLSLLLGGWGACAG